MEHTVEKLSGNKVKISFKAPAADFEQAIEEGATLIRVGTTLFGPRPVRN